MRSEAERQRAGVVGGGGGRGGSRGRGLAVHREDRENDQHPERKHGQPGNGLGDEAGENLPAAAEKGEEEHGGGPVDDPLDGRDELRPDGRRIGADGDGEGEDVAELGDGVARTRRAGDGGIRVRWGGRGVWGVDGRAGNPADLDVLRGGGVGRRHSCCENGTARRHQTMALPTPPPSPVLLRNPLPLLSPALAPLGAGECQALLPTAGYSMFRWPHRC
jgi:hypothetical protein